MQPYLNMIITLLFITTSLSCLESPTSEQLKKPFVFTVKNEVNTFKCLYVPQGLPLGKFQPKNIPKDEECYINALFSIDKPLYGHADLYDLPQYVLIASDAHKIIGGARIINDKSNDYIEHLYLLNEYRGKHIGPQLLDVCSLISYARKKEHLQVDAVPLGVNPTSVEKLMDFYKKNGFAEQHGKIIRKTSSSVTPTVIEKITYV